MSIYALKTNTQVRHELLPQDDITILDHRLSNFTDPIDIRRHICINAINGRSAAVDSKWDGTVPRSMVKVVIEKSFAESERT